MHFWKIKHIIFTIIIVTFLLYLSINSSYSLQDMESPCFFCHADLFFEIQDGTHEKNGLNCISCHGESKEHTFVEDNSVKPEKIYKKLDIPEFCGNCHNNELKDFNLSEHSKGTDNENLNVLAYSDCHKGHQFEKKIDIKICSECHADNPEKSTAANVFSEEELKLYNSHSLKK